MSLRSPAGAFLVLAAIPHQLRAGNESMGSRGKLRNAGYEPYRFEPPSTVIAGRSSKGYFINGHQTEPIGLVAD